MQCYTPCVSVLWSGLWGFMYVLIKKLTGGWDPRSSSDNSWKNIKRYVSASVYTCRPVKTNEEIMKYGHTLMRCIL